MTSPNDKAPREYFLSSEGMCWRDSCPDAEALLEYDIVTVEHSAYAALKAECEELRANIDTINYRSADGIIADNLKLTAEVARLREALEFYKDMQPQEITKTTDGVWATTTIKPLGYIARQALNQKPEGEK